MHYAVLIIIFVIGLACSALALLWNVKQYSLICSVMAIVCFIITAFGAPTLLIGDITYYDQSMLELSIGLILINILLFFVKLFDFFGMVIKNG